MALTATYHSAGASTSPSEQTPLSPNSPCSINRMTRYAMSRPNTPIFFATDPLPRNSSFESPHVHPLNRTTGEQWEFDGISTDGTRAFMFGFYRDPSFSVFGTGNLRFYLEFAFANGSRHAAVEYAEESVVETCPGAGGTRGVWRGPGWEFAFEVAEDMKTAAIFMDSPQENGKVVLSSVAPPRYADNTIWSAEKETEIKDKIPSSEPVPYFHWVEPIPVAEARVEATIRGERVSWTGMGGHERLWGAFNWFTCVASMTAVRVRAGPYALSLVQFGSNVEKGLVVPSVMLVEDGEVVFSTRRDEVDDAGEDYILFEKVYGGLGITTQSLADRATGFELNLHSPARGTSWKFTVTHLNIGFEYPFGGGFGSTGYSGVVQGGEVGGEQWHGPAYTEIMDFPEKSLLFSKNFV